MNTDQLIRKLRPVLCRGGARYVNSHPDPRTAWEECPRGDWLMSVAELVAPPQWVIAAATACLQGMDRPELEKVIPAFLEYTQTGALPQVVVPPSQYERMEGRREVEAYFKLAAAVAVMRRWVLHDIVVGVWMHTAISAICSSRMYSVSETHSYRMWERTQKQCAERIRRVIPWEMICSPGTF